MKKVIVRMKGGLGNQLFSYCASRRLALANEAELVIDNISGFSDDKQFRHYYALDSFNIFSIGYLSFAGISLLRNSLFGA